MRALIAVACFCSFTNAGLIAQSISGTFPPPSDASLGLPSTVDFPDRDEQVWSLQLGGLAAKVAARAMAEAPNQARTIRILMRVDRYDDAITVMRRIVDTRPNEIAAGFAALGSNWVGLVSEVPAARTNTLRGIVADAKTRITMMPRRQAAEVALEIVAFDSILDKRPSSLQTHLRAISANYPGTEPALLAQAELLGSTDDDARESVNRLDAFMAAHPGTTATAKALYLKGLHLSRDGVEPQGSDPTERFFRVVDVYKKLTSGRYPASDWTERASSLLTEFETNEPSYATGNIDKILAVYEQLLATMLPSLQRDTVADEIKSVGQQIGTLFKTQAQSIAAFERVFDRFERLAKRPDEVRLAKAQFYLNQYFPMDESAVADLERKGIAALESLVRQSTGYPRRKALAILAGVRFGSGNLAEARDLYRQYLETYPDSDYAWVAALRLGQAEAALGNATGARDIFLNTAQRFAKNPLAVVLGHALAARISETDGDYARALPDYQAALAGWDADYGDRYSLFLIPYGTERQRYKPIEPLMVSKDFLEMRIGDLKEGAGIKSGDPVERGGW
jgi:outer membrane protein assembly factor BamD (BamD/ComL family)